MTLPVATMNAASPLTKALFVGRALQDFISFVLFGAVGKVYFLVIKE
jgi:hypothetical protein